MMSSSPTLSTLEGAVSPTMSTFINGNDRSDPVSPRAVVNLYQQVFQLEKKSDDLQKKVNNLEDEAILLKRGKQSIFGDEVQKANREQTNQVKIHISNELSNVTKELIGLTAQTATDNGDKFLTIVEQTLTTERMAIQGLEKVESVSGQVTALNERLTGILSRQVEISNDIASLGEKANGTLDRVFGMQTHQTEISNGLASLGEKATGMHARQTEISNGLAAVDGRISNGMGVLEDKVTGMTDSVCVMLEGVSGLMNGIAGIGEKVTGMSADLTGMLEGMMGISNRVSTVGEKLTRMSDSLTGMISGMSNRMSTLEEKIARLDGILDQQQEVRNRVLLVGKKVTNNSGRENMSGTSSSTSNSPASSSEASAAVELGQLSRKKMSNNSSSDESRPVIRKRRKGTSWTMRKGKRRELAYRRIRPTQTTKKNDEQRLDPDYVVSGRNQEDNHEVGFPGSKKRKSDRIAAAQGAKVRRT